MAFLAAGHVPGEPGPYRETIERGIRYVLDHQKPNGLLVSNTSHGPMYCHGISTLMLAEVVGMTADPALAERVPRGAGQGRRPDPQGAGRSARTPTTPGGWRYQPTSRDSDLSVTGWQVMALRAAKAAGLRRAGRAHRPRGRLPQAVRRQGRRRVRLPARRRAEQPPDRHRHPRAGDLRRAPDRPRPSPAPSTCSSTRPRGPAQYFFYEVYYCPQAMFQVGDKYFLAYYPKLVADPARPPGQGRELALRRRQRPLRRPGLLHGDGRPGAGGRISLSADLSAV